MASAETTFNISNYRVTKKLLNHSVEEHSFNKGNFSFENTKSFLP